MVAATKLNDKQKAANSSVVQVEKLYRDQLRDCTAILRRHADARGPCLHYLTSVGWTKESTPAELAKSVATKANKKAQETKKAKKQQEDEERPADIAKKDDLGSKYWQLGSMTQTILLTRILPGMSPAVMSKRNVQGMFPKGAVAEDKKRVALEMIEFLTGEQGGMSLKGPFRDITKVIAYLKNKMWLRGRLDAEAPLPYDFESMGVYRVVSSNADREEVLVQHVYTKKEAVISVKKIGFQVPKKCKFMIGDNYSEQGARLTVDDDRYRDAGLKLGRYFPLQEVRAVAGLADPPTPVKSPGSSSASSSSKKRKRE